MVEKTFLVEPHRKAVTLVRHPSIMVVIGVGAFFLFIGQTVGTAQELPTGTISLSGRAFMERSDLGGISDPAATTHNAHIRRRQALVNGWSMTLLGSELSSS